MTTMEMPLQPELTKSLSEDDDNSTSPGSDKALEYLLRYETMVRQQDAEDVATLAHLRPLLAKIEKLGGKNTVDTPTSQEGGMEEIMAREVTFHQLQTALQELENDSTHVMTTDRQLMLVLKTLGQKSASSSDEESISWAEFYQCYKTVVAGMQTLQYVPSQGLTRSRTKDRTLTILSMFEPPSTKLFNEDVPRTIHTDQEQALEGRDYNNLGMIPELRKQRRKAIMLFGFLMLMSILVFGVFVESPRIINNGKSVMIDFQQVFDGMNQAMQTAKTAVAPWWPEHHVETTTAHSTARDAFLHHNMHTSKSHESPSPKTTSSTTSTTQEVDANEDVNTAVAVLAGASGVAIAPFILKTATALLQMGGLPGMGAVTCITMVAAPVLKGIDVVFGKVLRAVGSKNKSEK